MKPGTQALGEQIGRVQDHPPYPFGVAQGKQQGDVAAVTEAQKIGLADPVLVHEIEQVVGKLGEGEGGSSHGGTAVAPGIHSTDKKVAGKRGDLMLEIGAVLAVAVEEQQGGAVTGADGMKLNIHQTPP